MENLHSDIVENVLSRLPISTALQAKQICTIWRIPLRNKTDKVGLLLASSHEYEIKIKLRYVDQYDHIRGKMNYNYPYYDKMLNGKFVLECSRYSIINMLGLCNDLVCFAASCWEGIICIWCVHSICMMKLIARIFAHTREKKTNSTNGCDLKQNYKRKNRGIGSSSSV